MADLITGNTQLAPTKADIIAAVIQKELQFSAKLLPYVSDVSIWATKGAKTVNVPKLNSFTVTNRASGTPGDASQLTASADQIALSFNAYVSWIIDGMDEVQTSIEASIEFSKRAASSHGRFVDEKILETLEADAYLDVGAAPLTRDLVLDMREGLLVKNADISQVVLVAGPDQEKALLKIDEFSRADYYGGAVIPAGLLGKLYGIPVVIHNGVAAGKAYMFEKSGVGIAFQKAPAMSQQPANEYGTSAMRVAMDQLFGVDSLQQGAAGAAAGKSPLIVKL